MNKKRILVVDDTAPNLKLLGNILQATYSLSFATSGGDALKILEKFHPDLILLDIMMPGMDGFEVCRRVKANPVLNGIPILFITAKADKESVIRSYELGGEGYILKPFEMDDVLDRVRKLIPQSDQDSSGSLSRELYPVNPLMQKNRIRNYKLYISMIKKDLGSKLNEIEENVANLVTSVPTLIKYLEDMENLIFNLDKKSLQSVERMYEKVQADKLNPDLVSAIHSFYEEIQKTQFRLVDITSELWEDTPASPMDFFPVSLIRTLESAFPGYISFYREEGANPYITGSESSFMQVVLSLVDNAIEAAIPDNIKPEIVIRMEKGEGSLIFHIEDNGCGIGREDFQTLVKPFFSGKKNNPGLGLTAVEWLMTREFKGHFSLENRENGCRASLVFPVN